MDNSDQTGATAAGQGDAGGSPTLGDIIGGAVPGIASSAGSNFVSGATAQLSATIGPYLPYIVIGVAALILMRR